MLSKTIAQYKEMSQLQDYAMAQEQTILQISRKLQKLEEERDHLKTLLETSVPIIKTSPEGVQLFAENDTEYICNIEIGKLKQNSIVRELTLEESKRLDTYFKILTQLNSRPNKQEKEVKDLNTSDLLKLVENNDNGSN